MGQRLPNKASFRFPPAKFLKVMNCGYVTPCKAQITTPTQDVCVNNMDGD